MLLEQRWSKSEDEESTLPGKTPRFLPPLTSSKLPSYLSIIPAASLKRGTRARHVLVQEIADVEEVVVRVVKVADTVRRRNSERGSRKRRRK